MTNRSLAEWLELLEQRHPAKLISVLKELPRLAASKLANLSPDRSVDLMKLLLLEPMAKAPVSPMQSLLLAHGYSVGSFTSPHFQTITSVSVLMARWLMINRLLVHLNN